MVHTTCIFQTDAQGGHSVVYYQ